MNRYDMQDLIIEEEEFKEKKPKKVITLLALIIIILLVGTVIIKYAIGDNKNSNKEESKISQKKDNELAPPISNHKKIKVINSMISDDELSNIIPVKEKKPIYNELKEIDDKKENKPNKIENTPTKQNIIPSFSDTKILNQPEPSYKKEIKHKSRVHKIHKKHIAHKRTHKSKLKRIVHKTKPKHKITKLSKKDGIYYIQVGSFSKKPNSAYINNIKKHGYKFVLFKSAGLTKVRIGPYTNYEFAKSKLPTIKRDLGVSGFVVKVK